ncbi:MAG TPA: anti-sigma factor [Bryobacteraceae bacterium]|nr:anti-sigma factor [Bryobacteraceae bacterium]
MSCEELRDLYELYALGALEAEETAELDAHVARNCPTCVPGLKRALATNAVIASFVPDVEPPSRLRRKVLAGVGTGLSPRWGWMGAWATATAALLAGVLWFGIEDRRTASELAATRQQVAMTQMDLARVQQALQFLDEPETKQVGFGAGQPQPPRGNVFVNPNSGVLLIASNLPPAPAGKIYEMWIIPKSGAPKPAGLFQSQQNGSAFHLVPGPIDTSVTAAVAVSIEPEAGSATPTKIVIPPVAVGGM